MKTVFVLKTIIVWVSCFLDCGSSLVMIKVCIHIYNRQSVEWFWFGFDLSCGCWDMRCVFRIRFSLEFCFVDFSIYRMHLAEMKICSYIYASWSTRWFWFRFRTVCWGWEMGIFWMCMECISKNVFTNENCFFSQVVSGDDEWAYGETRYVRTSTFDGWLNSASFVCIRYLVIEIMRELWGAYSWTKFRILTRFSTFVFRSFLSFSTEPTCYNGML